MTTDRCRATKPLDARHAPDGRHALHERHAPDGRYVRTSTAPVGEHESLLSLHSSAGNRAVAQLLASVQRKVPTPPPPAGPAAPAAPANDARDWAESAVDELPEAQKKRFEAVEWGRLDFPGTQVPLKGLKLEEAQWWRDQTSVEEVSGKDGGYFKGANQAVAQELLSALATATSGGGERRVNIGRNAVLNERAFNLAPADFDKFIVGKLDSTPVEDDHQLHTAAATQFKAMKAAAKKEKVAISPFSAYRTRAAEEKKAKEINNPRAFGKFSPHAMGLAVDIRLKVSGSAFEEGRTGNFNKVLDMLDSPVYKWLSSNASQYGFFPYSSEPWHWEYNPSGFAEHFFDESPELQAKITEADQAEAAEKAKAKAEAAEKAAKSKKNKKKK